MKNMAQFSVIILLLIGLVQNIAAFSVPNNYRISTALSLEQSGDRRSFLSHQIITPLSITFLSTSLLRPNPAFASSSLLDKSAPNVPPFSGGVSEAKERFRRAIKDIDDLLENYAEISTNGDNVRLYLGTQGVKSNMYGITKVLKLLKDEADDVVEFTEAFNEFEAYLFQAEGAAYQSLFAEHSSAKSTPESLLKTARGDIVNMRKFMGSMAEQLDV